MTFTSRHRAEGALLLVAAIWGLTFPLIRTALADLDPARFLAARFALAILAFLPVLLLSRGARGGLRRALVPGLALGLLAFASYAAQTLALETAPAARVAFINGTHVVLVPLLSPLLRAGRPGRADLLAAMLALAGLFLLTDPSGGLTTGDLWALACAVGYAFYIHALHKAIGRKFQVEALAFAQVAGLALASTATLPLAPAAAGVWSPTVWVALGFTALIATVAVFWLQTRYQGRTTPERAALLFVTEPVFALLFAWLILGERFTLRESLGAAFIVGAVLGIEVLPRLLARRRAAVAAAGP